MRWMLALLLMVAAVVSFWLYHESDHFLRHAGWKLAGDERCLGLGDAFTLNSARYLVLHDNTLRNAAGEPVGTLIKRRFRLVDTELYIRDSAGTVCRYVSK